MAASDSSSPWESKITFKALVDFLESVAKEADRKRRVSKLERFLAQCRNVMSKYGKSGGSTALTAAATPPSARDDVDSLYPVMRLLLPDIDKGRSAYGIKETLLAKVYVDLLKLGPSSADAMKLKNYRAPKGSTSSSGSRGDAGDFGAVLFSVVKDRTSVSGDGGMTVAEVNAELDALVSASAADGRRGVERVLMGFFRRMPAVQQKWLVRIVLKDVKAGLGQKALMNGLHPDANDLFDVNASLKKVCQSLRDPAVRRHEIEVGLFDPFKPMLADRCQIRNVVKELGNKEFYIEVKYDGERMQLHMDEGGAFKFYSRNGFDFSDDFGRSAGDLDKFSYHAARCLAPHVKSVILDGEICAYNFQTDSLTQKGEQMNIRNLRVDDPMFQQCLYVYDVVYLNGKVLTNKPLRERIEIVKECIKEERGRVQLAERKTGKTAQDVVDALNDAIDRREEGLVLKDPDSVYKPNVRTKGGWIKVKPEYSGSLMDQCDLIVMGGYYGSGRRGGLVTHFLLGLAVPSTSADNGASADPDESSSHALPREFRSFCRVGSGYSYRELFDLLRRLEPNFKKLSSRQREESAVETEGGYRLSFSRERPDVWIDPRRSVLLQVKAAEIVSSEMYRAGCTLRFPRVEKIRSESDKPWHSCMTVTEMESLRREGEGKLANRHLELDEEDHTDGAFSQPKKRRKGGAGSSQRSRPATLSSVYRQAADPSSVMVESHDLKGKVVVVEPCDARLKKRLEETVLKLGGTCEQNVSRGRTFCYVETGFKVRAKTVAKRGECDVVKHEWLLDCETKFRPFRPSDMIQVSSAETKARFARDFDSFGDAFSSAATALSLRYSMSRVAELGEEAAAPPGAIAEFEAKFFERPFKYGLFRQLRFFVARGNESLLPGHHPLDLVETTLRFHGGTVAPDLDAQVTHVLVLGAGEEEEEEVDRDPVASDPDLLSELKLERRRREKKFHIVTQRWVEECLDRVDILQEREPR